MTRINLIPPQELFDQHLMAEYREIFMVPAALARTIKSKKGLMFGEYPKNYVLGRGHVVFFFNKGKYLDKRYKELCAELEKRGFKLDKSRRFPVGVFKDNKLYNDWTPKPADIKIIKARIAEKISLKPGWYRKTAYKKSLKTGK